ncbi:hypothetical protein [Vagococcus fluvialis]|uniref:hypothetical protein n=1 Tax=Vagococcus fluvialis TaxID=2738 RepID=UPI003B20FE8C
MVKVNSDIRKKIEKNRLKYYEVADAIGISDSRFSVWLRKELDGERRERTLKAIEELIS